jgi:uncharacterized repeat protein (TIGR01451 family)
MRTDLTTTHSKIKISLVKTIAVCVLMCGTVITGQQRDQRLADGPISVKLGDVFEKGKIQITNADLSTLPALPRGYSAVPKMAYRITTDSVAVGPYTVVFGVPSITDEATFNNLRVFHAEPDQFDPDSPVWIDRTASGNDAPASDFSHKTITAYSDELWTGIYIIAKQTEKIPPSTAVADVEVVAEPAPDMLQMPANITLSMTIKNNGPQTATNVGLRQELPSGTVVSMKASQGTCKTKPFRVYCKIGQLAAGRSATVAVIIDPSPDFLGSYVSFVEVAAIETDSNPDNNQGAASADTLGDPNLRPDVTLESPDTQQPFQQGETVVLKATANDPDGTITKVEFLDNDESLGIGATTDGKHFSFSSSQLTNGRHVLNAIATDNGGRRTRSNAQHIFVNGPCKVQILNPKKDGELTEGSDLTLTAVARNPVGSIKKVEFFFNGGFSLGQATALGDDRYTIKITGLMKTSYSIEAVATDNAGLISKSVELRFRVPK